MLSSTSVLVLASRSLLFRALSVDAAGRGSNKGASGGGGDLGRGGKAAVWGQMGQVPKGNSGGGGELKPLKLSYTCLEDRRKDMQRKGALVIHHSLLGCRKNWTKVAKEIHHLTHRKVVTPDARNHGESPHSLEMSYSLLAKDMQFLIKHVGEEKVSFLGHSMGGRVGMILALTQPQLIEKLICVDSTPINTPVSLDRWETLVKACRQLSQVEGQLRATRGVYRSILAEKVLRPILPNARDRSLFVANLLATKDQPPSGGGGKSSSSSGGGAGQDDQDEGGSGEGGEPRLWRLNIDSFVHSPRMPASFPTFTGVTFDGPSLFIAGENSKFMRKEHEPEIRRLFPNSKIVWIQGKNAGHWIHEDMHEEFMQEVVPFLENDD